VIARSSRHPLAAPSRAQRVAWPTTSPAMPGLGGLAACLRWPVTQGPHRKTPSLRCLHAWESRQRFAARRSPLTGPALAPVPSCGIGQFRESPVRVLREEQGLGLRPSAFPARPDAETGASLVLSNLCQARGSEPAEASQSVCCRMATALDDQPLSRHGNGKLLAGLPRVWVAAGRQNPAVPKKIPRIGHGCWCLVHPVSGVTYRMRPVPAPRS